jgi:hypothetical protein
MERVTTHWGRCTVIVTCIFLLIVPIVTGLHALVDNTITTECILAGVQTLIAVVTVAIVASLLADPKNSVTATGIKTVVETSIQLQIIAIVTVLNPLQNDPITAFCQMTVVQAFIPIERVPIVTSFDACVDQPIATTRGNTVVQASVGLDGVAIIACFLKFHATIATHCEQASIIAAVEIIVIPVVALLHISPHDTITTAGDDTAVETNIRIDLIAIVTGFEARLVRRQIIT